MPSWLILVLDSERDGNAIPVCEGDDVRGGVAEIDRDHGQPLFLEFTLQRCDSGNLPLARPSIGEEEFNQNGLAPKVRQSDLAPLDRPKNQVAGRHRRSNPPNPHRGKRSRRTNESTEPPLQLLLTRVWPSARRQRLDP